ncbi:hypothetical protein Vadar_005834 [Vaccinium darrowii]|uniref:Uncharacterized protein n=1 Tax=Vaccinium darrowii TaxID=229202 RepID=A0ACB7XG54_9ERIC|nr:hypothetical protein Vadar_005834 [Vaccinium darrowii]
MFTFEGKLPVVNEFWDTKICPEIASTGSPERKHREQRARHVPKRLEQVHDVLVLRQPVGDGLEPEPGVPFEMGVDVAVAFESVVGLVRDEEGDVEASLAEKLG